MSYAWLKARRWWLARKQLAAPLQDLLCAELPSVTTAIGDAEFVALDIETTGLDAGTAHMLSVGWVIVRGGRVDLSTAETHIVRPEGEVGDSAAVHGLTDTMVGAGLDRGVVVDKIVSALTGRVLLVHHAGLDKALLDRLCRERYGAPLMVPVVDTLAFEHRRQQRNHHLDAGKSLKLLDLREEYGLPRYAAHDCLVDAIATGELLLAMIAHRNVAQLRDLLS